VCDRFISLSSEMLMWLVIISGCKVWDLRQDQFFFFLIYVYKNRLLVFVGLRAQIIYWALGLGREHEQSEEEQMVMNDLVSGFNEQDTNGRSV